jgi:hypothetical protein
MSEVRNRLLQLLPSLSARAKSNSEPVCKIRFGSLRRIAESRDSVELAADKLGKSHQWFYKWAKVLVATKSIKGASKGKGLKIGALANAAT